MDDLSQLLTESLHPEADGLSATDSLALVESLHAANLDVLPAVERALADVALAVDLVVATFRAGGHLLYLGAGTSGRLGALDAAECPPTFGASPELFQFAIAGGQAALTSSVEQAEDDPAAGAAAVAAQTAAGDTVIGIAASGRTPYVIGGLEAARATGRKTVFLTCNPSGGEGLAEVLIRAVVGPEIIAGSTRMKAGTATKLILNMISSATMIRLGKVYRGRMVDLQTRCGKLVDRAERMVIDLGQCDPQTARRLLGEASGSAKLAIVMARRGVDARAAEQLLRDGDGQLAAVLDRA